LSEIARFRLSKGLRLAGRVIGCLVIMLCLIMIFGRISVHNSNNIEFYIILGITIIAGAGIIISWWQRLIASILLFFALIPPGIQGFYSQQIWIIIGISYFFTSFLIFVSWRISPKK
jgi:hypothetical protein